MRRDHCTITPSAVRATARDALAAALPWRAYGRLVTAGKLIDLLLLVAAVGSSLSAVVRRFLFGLSHETARKAVAANLPALDDLTRSLVDALYRFGSRALRRRRWVVAIDLHLSPFYGDRATPGVVGGQKKQGTKYFYAYATACLVHRRHRYTVGLLPLAAGGLKPFDVVSALLAQMGDRGLRLRGVVLDAGFDCGRTLLLLQHRGLCYAVPLGRKGKGDSRRNACFALPPGSVTDVEWVVEATRERVATRAVVVRRSKGEAVKVYAFGGWLPGEAASAARRGRLARRWYRKRFGIETGYRQMNEFKGKTTRKDAAYRLLLVGVALLMRQTWAWLTWQVARAWGLRPSEWVAALPALRLRDWLADALRRKYKEQKEIHLGTPLLPLDRVA